LILIYDWNARNQKKIIFFTLRKNYAPAFINGIETVLLTDLNSSDKNFQFFVKPALEQSQINKIHFVSLKTDTLIHQFIKKDKQIIFNNYKILVIDESLNYKNLNVTGKFSSIWLTGNTKFKLENLPQKVQYQNIIIDAINKDYKIATFKTFAENNSVPVHILKKNPAYLVYLTQ